jgi:hypothetical protein
MITNYVVWIWRFQSSCCVCLYFWSAILQIVLWHFPSTNFVYQHAVPSASNVFKSSCLLIVHNTSFCRSQWPCGLRRGSSAARLLGSCVRIPPGAWMSVCCECCVLWGRGLCDGLITRPGESYRLWCVSNVYDHETSTKRGGPGPYRAVEP